MFNCVEVRISYTIFRLFTLVVIWLLFLRSFLVPLLELFPSCRSTINYIRLGFRIPTHDTATIDAEYLIPLCYGC